MSATAERPTVSISLAAHHVFCPRRAWLESVGEVTDTRQVAVGVAAHGRTDDASTARREQVRAVDIVHEQWGLTGRCDTLERLEDGTYRVIEYKATPVRRRTEVTEAMRLQLAMQVAALSSMGYSIAEQVIYFTEHRQRVPVTLSEADFEAAEKLVKDTRITVESRTAPPPLEDSPRCTACSHVAVCMPDERNLGPVRRRIVVADPDTQVVHLATPGSRASVRSGRLVVQKNGEELSSIPLERVQGVAVHGNVDLSGALIRELLWRQLSIVWCTSRGRVTGWASSTSSPNGATRVAQHVASAQGHLGLAREFVSAKISNQATLLRRNGDAPKAVAAMRALVRAADEAADIPELYGIEGDGASLYFENFSTMLRAPKLTFDARSRRPARDPVNAALNYGYALLLGDVIRAVRSCGLDPHAGFLHSSTRNKPALALDLCEELRSVVADSAVVRAFNNGELAASDFHDTIGSVSLTEKGRKALISAYERRVQGEFTHPVFGYRVTWRRAMEIQARQVLGVLDGTQPRYAGIRMR